MDFAFDSNTFSRLVIVDPPRPLYYETAPLLLQEVFPTSVQLTQSENKTQRELGYWALISVRFSGATRGSRSSGRIRRSGRVRKCTRRGLRRIGIIADYANETRLSTLSPRLSLALSLALKLQRCLIDVRIIRHSIFMSENTQILLNKSIIVKIFHILFNILIIFFILIKCTF